MADNVTHLPRPRTVRPSPEPLGLYVRACHNDHKELLNLLSAGILSCSGVVIDATQADRHKELKEQIVERRLDAILDPKTQAAATVGGYTRAIGELLWGLERPHEINDFTGLAGKERIEQLGNFVVEHGFTQVLAPTHLLQDAHDPWLARDIEATEQLRANLDRNGGVDIPLVYSPAISYRTFRNGVERRKLVNSLNGIPASAVWLKVERFGSSSTSTAACNYIDAATGIPLPGSTDNRRSHRRLDWVGIGRFRSRWRDRAWRHHAGALRRVPLEKGAAGSNGIRTTAASIYSRA